MKQSIPIFSAFVLDDTVYEKSITPPHLYECFNTVNLEHCISQDPELLFPLHTFALQL
jgi:hypothetical protein